MRWITQIRRGLAIALVGVLGACATPDLEPFAQQTAQLATLAKGELKETTKAYEWVAIEMEKKQGDGAWDPSLREKAAPVLANKPYVDEHAAALAKVFSAAVKYAGALDSLAKSGETGDEAAKKALGHLKTLGQAFNAPSFGLSGTASDVFVEAAKKIAKFAEAQIANTTLREAVAAAHPVVEDLGVMTLAVFSYCRDGLAPPCKNREVEGSPQQPFGQWYAAMASVRTLRESALRSRFGREIIGTAEDLEGARNDIYEEYHKEFDEARDHGLCVGPDTGDVQCIDPIKLETLGRLDDRWLKLEPDLAAFRAEVAQVEAWKNERFEQGAKLTEAVAAWVRAHQQVVESLQECQFNIWRCRPADALELKSVLDESR